MDFAAVLESVIFGCKPIAFSETAAKIVVRGIAYLSGNRLHGLIGLHEQLAGAFQAFVRDIIQNTHPHGFLEDAAQIAARKPEYFRELG